MTDKPFPTSFPTKEMIEAGCAAMGVYASHGYGGNRQLVERIYLAMHKASPGTEAVERVVNDFAVKVTEHAIMALDADEENMEQIEAFGTLVEQEFRAAITALTSPAVVPRTSRVRIDTICPGVTGSQYYEVTRIEEENDGSLTAVIEDCSPAVVKRVCIICGLPEGLPHKYRHVPKYGLTSPAVVEDYDGIVEVNPEDFDPKAVHADEVERATQAFADEAVNVFLERNPGALTGPLLEDMDKEDRETLQRCVRAALLVADKTGVERYREALTKIAASKLTPGARYNPRMAREYERVVGIARTILNAPANEEGGDD